MTGPLHSFVRQRPVTQPVPVPATVPVQVVPPPTGTMLRVTDTDLLKFTVVGDDGKHYRIDVEGQRSKLYLGEITFHQHWDRYVFSPGLGITFLDAHGMGAVVRFLNYLQHDYRHGPDHGTAAGLID